MVWRANDPVQTEKAFQKQEGVFLNSKKQQAKKTSTGVRFYKKVGLGKFPSPPLGSCLPTRLLRLAAACSKQSV